MKIHKESESALKTAPARLLEPVVFLKRYARVGKAQSKGHLNEQTNIARMRDLLLNERALQNPFRSSSAQT